ncbi:Smr/MutS family protein [Ferribacterium limneticum]|uniref:Smr/MutS family protein n=1 Tax=Ferribacterium limneticum TaxID=76259 RepID=UPI001CFAB75E|nr:Smr/MutS family protein [Ferribacterium limneticum]
MIDPEDIAAFQAEVADIKPLPPVNRVQLNKPKPAAPSRPSVSEKKPVERKKPRQEALPAHWNTPAEAKPPATLDPVQAEFRAAMSGVQPLPPPNLVEHGKRPPPPRPLQHLADEQAALHESLHGFISLQDRLEGGDEPHYLRTGLAQNVLRDLRRGRWVIQDEIDLHGLNRDEARHLLAGFLAECLHHGKRCVRVVHGKGLGSPQKTSILRQLVRGWLAQRQEVLAYCQAKPPDGGEGALIVLLRNQK